MAEKLTRYFGFYALLIYGVGDILGAGIYAVIGKVAGDAGSYTWASFLVAMTIAMLTALSYSELCARHPKSGGVAHFVNVAFKNKFLAYISGWLLITTCLFSIAALGIVFAGYLENINVNIPKFLSVGIMLAILGLINFRGIKESSSANILATAVEVSGLIFVIYVAIDFLTGSQVSTTNANTTPWNVIGIIKGASLAFFAFIGFEDLANIAEEVKKPERDIPRAIILSVIITGVIYVLIAWLSTQVTDPNRLADSSAALALVVEDSGYQHLLTYFGLVAIFAVSNTSLLNSITASRLLYGMSEDNLLPDKLGTVHEKFKTPYVAIAVVVGIAYALSFIGSLSELAGATSLLVLTMFCLTNISLIKIKRRDKNWQGFEVPLAIPIIALIANIGLMSFAPLLSLYILLGTLVLGIGLKKLLFRHL